MCLAVPAKIISRRVDDLLGELADVDLGGAVRAVSVACVPEAREGDYVIIHAGVALSVMSEDDAMDVLTEWARGVSNGH
jgi:hydrogenase expression/formation protein HypC